VIKKEYSQQLNKVNYEQRRTNFSEHGNVKSDLVPSCKIMLKIEKTVVFNLMRKNKVNKGTVVIRLQDLISLIWPLRESHCKNMIAMMNQ